MDPSRPIAQCVTGNRERVDRITEKPKDGMAALTHGFHHHTVVDVDVADKGIVVTHNDGVRVMPGNSPGQHRPDGREPDDSCQQRDLPPDAGARVGNQWPRASARVNRDVGMPARCHCVSKWKATPPHRFPARSRERPG